MIGLKINNRFLDLAQNTALQFDLRPYSFLTSTNSDIQGGFSYTINVKRTHNNLIALDHPHRLDAHESLLVDEPIELHYAGLPIFKGKAYLKNGGSSIRLFIILNELSALKDTKLSEINLGGDRPFGGPSEALTIAANHLSYDFAFFPIKNNSFFSGYDDDPGTGSSTVQNHFANGAFTDASDQLNAMPFIRLEYLIHAIVKELGYSLDDQFFIDNELRSIYLYNNVSFYSSGAWPNTINLSNHVPDMKVTEFLKKFLAQYNLGIFLNPFTLSAELIGLDEIVSSPPAVDWTSKLVGNNSFTTNAGLPGKLRYAMDEDDSSMEGNPQYAQEFSYEPYLDDGDLDFIPHFNEGILGFHWVNSTNALHYFAPGGLTEVLRYSLRHREVFDGEVFDGGLIPLLQDPEFLAANYQYFRPIIKTKGSLLNQGTTPSDWQNDFGCRVVFYRGMIDGVPSASSGWYEHYISHVSSFNRSLYWHDAHGVYHHHWRKSLAAFKTKKLVSMNFNLSIIELYNLRFQCKVRVGDINYVISRVRPIFKQNRMGVTKVELIACV